MTRIPRFCHFTDVCHHLCISVVSVSITVWDRFYHTIQYVCNRFRHFYTLSVIGSVVLCTIQLTYTACLSSVSDKFRHFYMSVIDSAVWNRFYHTIQYVCHRFRCLSSVSNKFHHFCVLCHSAIFAYHFSMSVIIPPFCTPFN